MKIIKTIYSSPQKIFFIFLIIFLAEGDVYAIETPSGWLSDYGKAIELSLKTSKPILLDVYAPWCPFCEKLHNRVYPSPEFKLAAKDFITVSLNGENHPEIARKFEIRGTPVIIFLDKNGYELDRVTGYLDSGELTRLMSSVKTNAKIESTLMSELAQNPNGVLANYRAGVYYSDTGNHDRARKYFLHAWNTSEKGPVDKKMDSLYNAAVSSMELKDYRTSISHWNVYLLLKHERDEDYTFAHYYRGISYKFLGSAEEAKKDLSYARDHFQNEKYKRSAVQLLTRLQ